MVKNKLVNDKVVFLFKRKTTLVVNNKHSSFVIDNSLPPVCVKSILQRHKQFLKSSHMHITSKSSGSLKTYRLLTTKLFVCGDALPKTDSFHFSCHFNLPCLSRPLNSSVCCKCCPLSCRCTGATHYPYSYGRGIPIPDSTDNSTSYIS